MPITLQPNLCLLRFGRQPSDQAQLGRAYPLERERENKPVYCPWTRPTVPRFHRGVTMKSRGKNDRCRRRGRGGGGGGGGGRGGRARWVSSRAA